ncbi:hypothetical protein GTS_19130 [Gandjariella thermophila]|uniref:Type I restriction modification DNA specificity domain-containing protein n=2 Tax=Gandjariella thermophila TaxID=1931992 RepID=A0A4D4J5B6_9PSEU|nr:hypothetical protein GTS_19130 [Gandjariella thermophila]
MRPYIRAANVGWDGLKLDDVKEMNFTDEEAEVYRLQPGDIVLGEASGTPSEVGKPAIWNGEIDGCCFQNTLIRVRSYGADPKFLMYYLKYQAIQGAFVEKSRGVGIYHLGAARLAEWPIFLPPLTEQRRIVAALDDHLSRLDVGGSQLDHVGARIKHLVSAMRQWHIFGGALPGASVPSGWRLGCLADVLDRIEAGKSFACEPRPAEEGEWGVIKVSAMTWGEFRPEENKAVPSGYAYDARYEIRPGDILERYSGRLDHLKVGQRPRSGKIVFLPQNTTYRRGRCVTSLLQDLLPTRSRSLLLAFGRSPPAIKSKSGLQWWDYTALSYSPWYTSGRI